MKTSSAPDSRARRASHLLAGTAIVSLMLVAAACGSSSPSSTATTTTAAAATTVAGGSATTAAGGSATTVAGATTTAASATTAAQATTTVTSPAAACATPGAAEPAGSVSEKTLDVDGDGKPDTLWLSPGVHRMVGITTAAGGSSAVEVNSASPIPLSAFVVDAQGTRPYQVLVSDGREAYLYVFLGCKVQPVHNKQGQLYTFSLGFGDIGTGVGCNTIQGKPHLVGLNAQEPVGNTVKWTRTVVNVNGTSATNGITQSGTFTKPADQHGIDLLSTLSCGNQTITANGIHAPE